MKHRTQDHLFAAAGVTAALSLIGTGATVLKGSVFHFDHWPLAAGESARLPTAPIQVAEATPSERQSARQALLGGATRVGGTAALLPGLGGHSGISAIGTTIPAPAGTTVPAGGSGGSGSGSRGGSTTAASRVAAQDGFGFSVGPQPSSSIDGTRDPAGSSTGSTSTGAPRVASGDDTDGDGIPDTWEKNHGAPSTPTDTSSYGSSTSDEDHSGQTVGSAFNADPGTPTTTDPGTPPPATTDPGTGTGDTGSGTTDTTPPPTDTGSGDGSGDGSTTTPPPADGGDASTTPPADTTTPPPADTTPPPADTPPTDPTPADPAPPADPPPSQDTTTTQTAPATDAAPAANAAVPSSVQ
jgi:hypothetical protein